MSKPALLGGDPMRPHGPPSWPIPDDDVRRQIEDAFLDGSWGKYHGAYVAQLETALRDYFQVQHVLLCGSGTYAVELALRAVHAGPGTEVAMAAYDYSGNFLCIHAVGAHPVLVDVHPQNRQLSLDALEQVSGEKIRAVIASHLHGGLVRMREIREWADERNIAVIEDAAQAPGAMVQGRKAGMWGDVGVISFGGSKLLTAGRGGALLTNRSDIYHRAKRESFRGNWVCPLSEMQAAVLLPQLAKLDERNAHRLEMVRRLIDQMQTAAGITPACGLAPHDENNTPVFYKLGFHFEEEKFGLSRDLFTNAIRAEGIAMDAGFNALHVGRSPRRYRAAGDLTEAERAHHATIVLHHPVLLGDEMDITEIGAAIEKIHNFADELKIL